MKEKTDLGKKGEEIACQHLLDKGLTIVRRNYFFNHSEVDIIAEYKEFIIFVEVKTRVSAYLSDPALLVPIKKQKRIISAADNFVKEFFPLKEWRFDIIIVITNSEYTSIEHIEDAFYPMV